MTLDEVRRVKRDAEAGLMATPGVTGVGVGRAERPGGASGGAPEPAFEIRVYATDPDGVRKRVPERIEGVPVRVVGGAFTPHGPDP